MLRVPPLRSYVSVCSRNCRAPTFHRRSSTVSLPSISALLYPVSQPCLLSDGDACTVRGFVRSVRRQKRVTFASIGDGSTLQPLQVVLQPGQAEGLSTGTAVSVTGEWKQSPANTEQSHELHAATVQILGGNEADTYPIQKKYHSLDFLRTVPHLRSRTPNNSLLLRLRSQVINSATNFFEDQEFIQTHPPIITSSDCEGAGEVFSVASNPSQHAKHDVDYFFREPKYLTVSSQLHLEALAQSVGKVWTLSPTFRAEQSDTARHLSEFYMLEAEISFIDDLQQIMDIVERLVQRMVTRLRNSIVGEELLSVRDLHKFNKSEVTRSGLEKRWVRLIEGKWPRIPYTAAVLLLQEAVSRNSVCFEFPVSLGTGLQAEHEKYIADTVGNGGPVFVTDYPRDSKAFYMAPTPSPQGCLSSGPTVSCFDLLIPDMCEIAGGSMREHRLDAMLTTLENRGMLLSESTTQPREGEIEGSRQGSVPIDLSRVPESLRWYVDLRRYGSVPHGGFGLGFDRLLCYLSGVSSIRDVVTFPRWHGRCDC